MRPRHLALGLALAAGCAASTPASSSSPASASTGGSGAGASTGSSGTGTTTAGGSSGTTSASAGSTSGGTGAVGLAARYPGDVGLDADPAVVWHEDFEEGSVAAVTARYDDVSNAAGMALQADPAPGSAGGTAIAWTAGGSTPATHLFKKLPDHDELYARWYVKYGAGVPWHHAGLWLGGYNPPLAWPDPQAGTKPNGDDRVSISIEPVYGVGSAAPRLDFYNYWMQMHSWMDQPSGSTAYYGNSLVHQLGFTVDEGRWMCLEVHVALNTDPSSSAGAVLEVWKNDELVQRFDGAGPMGYWVRDKFCPQSADGTECTDYPPASGTAFAPADLQFRSTTALHLNAFWPQNYITDTSSGTLELDDMVVATTRVGCHR